MIIKPWSYHGKKLENVDSSILNFFEYVGENNDENDQILANSLKSIYEEVSAKLITVLVSKENDPRIAIVGILFLLI